MEHHTYTAHTHTHTLCHTHTHGTHTDNIILDSSSKAALQSFTSCTGIAAILTVYTLHSCQHIYRTFIHHISAMHELIWRRTQTADTSCSDEYVSTLNSAAQRRREGIESLQCERGHATRVHLPLRPADNGATLLVLDCSGRHVSE